MKSKINSLIFLFCSFLICLTVLCSNWERNNPLDPKSNSYVEPVKKPTIINHPKDQIVFEGEKATFSVTATGADLKYQWKRNESIISGATNSSYTISAVNIDDDGLYYYCVVSNSAGSVASNNASLHVKSVESPIVKPIITNHPKNQFVNEGEKATFSVTASGKNLSYQWKKNGSNISGATNSSYTTSVVDSYDDYDYYSCVISNSAGSTTSNTAYLYVKSVNNDNLLSKPAVLDDFNDEYGDTPNQTTVGAVYGASKFGIAYKGGGYWYSYCDDGGSMVTTIKGVIVSSSDDASAFLVKDAGDGMFAFKLITSKSKDEYPYSVVACNLAGDDTKKGRVLLDFSAMTSLSFRAKGEGSFRILLKTSDFDGEDWGHYGYDVTLTSSWKTYTVAASKLVPETGHPMGTKKKTFVDGASETYVMELKVKNGADATVYIDDIKANGAKYEDLFR